jgi:hypothetical protein
LNLARTFGICKATDQLVSEHSREIASLKLENENIKTQASQEKAAKDKENAALKARLDQIEKMLKSK